MCVCGGDTLMDSLEKAESLLPLYKDRGLDFFPVVAIGSHRISGHHNRTPSALYAIV